MLAVAASALLLAGCATPAGTDSPDSATETPQTQQADPTPQPTETPPPSEEPIPFAIECDALVTLDQMYAFNPNYGYAPDYAPSAAHIVDATELQGTACGWLNQSSGDIIEIAVATPPPGELTSRLNAAALEAKPVPTYGTPPAVSGYFTSSATEAQIFVDEYWLVLSSPAFVEPGDAQQLASAVLENLTAG